MSTHYVDLFGDPREYLDNINDLMHELDQIDRLQLNNSLNGRSSVYSLMGTQLLLVGNTRVSIDIQLCFEGRIAKLSELSNIHLDISYTFVYNSNEPRSETDDADVLYNGSSNESNNAEQQEGRQFEIEELDEGTRFNNPYNKTFVITPTDSDKLKKRKRYSVITEHIAVDVKIKENGDNVLPTVALIVSDLTIYSDPNIIYRAVGLINGENMQNAEQSTNSLGQTTWNEIHEDPAMSLFDELSQMSFDDEFYDDSMIIDDESITRDELLSSDDESDDKDCDVFIYKFTEPYDFDDASANELLDVNQNSGSNGLFGDDYDYDHILEDFDDNIFGGETHADQCYPSIGTRSVNNFNHIFYQIAYSDDYFSASNENEIVNEYTPTNEFPLSTFPIHQRFSVDFSYNAERSLSIFDDRNQATICPSSSVHALNETSEVDVIHCNPQISLNTNGQAADNFVGENNVTAPITGLTRPEAGLGGNHVEIEELFNERNDVRISSHNQSVASGEFNEEYEISDQKSKHT
ncbi:uncharacterized protein LOC119687068 isoform X1 [Teleopsis dalmanni]|uniref:uncharacterized protein LOC119687068 isoform X1 n=1 Tax=Teleopsis dalmanni TaxID=139649 RepID=UPI0018CCE1B8|nr:uncharacterized protein LOC119687068 isoform X1 [Teleopsis dalmanni]